jgi:hypothetical protein
MVWAGCWALFHWTETNSEGSFIVFRLVQRSISINMFFPLIIITWQDIELKQDFEESFALKSLFLGCVRYLL